MEKSTPQTQEPNEHVVQDYQTPELIEYGAMETLTRSGGADGQDGLSGSGPA